MKYDCVFLDMDGVLADFMSGAFRAHNREYNVAHYPRGCWEIADHWNIPVDDFWSEINADPDFWVNLKKYQWFDELIQLAQAHGSEVKILTSPARSPECYAGKRIWHYTHIPQSIELIICKSKKLIAAPDRLLIDDGDHNIDAWRANGGKAIVFPQPWNDHWHLSDDPMAYVRRKLAPHSGPTL